MSANAYKDFIKPFTGEGDVVSFITKVELVAGLKKIEDEAKFLPLYLEGHALAIYLERVKPTENIGQKLRAG